MQLKRDVLTIEETLTANSETIISLLDKACLDYNIGDLFFKRMAPEAVYKVVDFEVDLQEGYMLTSDQGEKMHYDEIFPLFSTGMLIQLLSDLNDFHLQAFAKGWLLLWDGHICKQSKDDESLLMFLWRSLCEIVESDDYEW